MECTECGIEGHTADAHDLFDITGRDEEIR